MAQDVNFKTVARITAGFSGADLANLLNEAAILAARGNKKAIDNVDIYEAFDKTIMGLKKKSHVITEADKRVTAYHEAGHAVLAELCKFCDPVHEVTIIPRGNGAGGFTMTRPVEDSSFRTYNEMRDDICMTLGGRAAEAIVLKNVTWGASADLRSVTSTARRMVMQYGMSEELGLVAYGSDQPVFMGMEYGHSSHDYSQETAAKIDKEVRRIINEEYEKAVRLLQENRSILDNMARVLVEKETIYTEEVSLLMKGASYKEVIEAIENSGNDREKDPFARMVKPEAEETEKTEKAEDSVDADAGQSLEELANEAMKKLSGNLDDKEQE
jgi:cell division protease FtsH